MVLILKIAVSVILQHGFATALKFQCKNMITSIIEPIILNGKFKGEDSDIRVQTLAVPSSVNEIWKIDDSYVVCSNCTTV